MHTVVRLLALFSLVFMAGTAAGQWPTDPAANLPLGDGDGDQVVPHLAINPDGSCYTGWYTNKSGNYDVALQYLSSDGTEQWPHGGILVSTHPQNSWVMDWALIIDSGDNAVVAFADVRGGSSNIHIYKIAPDGTFLWGADGIDITDNTDGKGPPSLVETNDEDIVVAWHASPTVGSPAICIQRLTSAGTPLYGDGGIPVTEAADSSPTGAVMVPSGEHDFIMGYVPIYIYMANRQIKTQRFDANGLPVWPDYLMVMDDATVPMGHYFQMMSDGQGGAFFGWSVVTGMSFTVRAQHVDADGVEGFVHNGLLVSTEASFSQIAPGITHDPISDELTVLYIQQTHDQNQKGVFGQRIDAAGLRLWSDTGRQILPVDTTIEGFVRALDIGDGVIGLCFQAPQNTYDQDQVIGFKVDTDGYLVWDPALVGVSTALSGKDDLVAVLGSDCAARAIWTDQRNGSYDIFGQNLNGDGSLGPIVVSAPDAPSALVRLYQNHPNPFNPATSIVFELARREYVVLRVFDVKGRLVRTLLDGEAGPGLRTVRWDGLGIAGAEIPSGVYSYRLETRGDHRVGKMVMIR